MRRRLMAYMLLLALASTARAGERTFTVDVDGVRVAVKVTEVFDHVSMVRAECVIPVSQEHVWKIVSDYDRIEEFVPAVQESEVVGRDGDDIILRQTGRAGLWFFQRGFELTLRVRQVPMSYVGFELIDGDFREFSGTWQVAAREGGTWIAHRVEIAPDFFAPGWATRRVARRMMKETIEGLISECMAED